MNADTVFAWFSEKLTPGAIPIYGIFLLMLRFFAREFRENRKLSAADRQARREGFDSQVNALRTELAEERAENRQLSADLRASRVEQDEYRRLCVAENEQLRQHIISVEYDLAGAMRTLATQALQLGKIGSMVPPLPPRDEG